MVQIIGVIVVVFTVLCGITSLTTSFWACDTRAKARCPQFQILYAATELSRTYASGSRNATTEIVYASSRTSETSQCGQQTVVCKYDTADAPPKLLQGESLTVLHSNIYTTQCWTDPEDLAWFQTMWIVTLVIGLPAIVLVVIIICIGLAQNGTLIF